jgi:imidazoleglycerol-phosphate dehydratase
MSADSDQPAVAILDYGMGNLRSVEKAIEHVGARPYVAFDAAIPTTEIAGFETELAEEFFRAVANSAKLTLHIVVRAGTNAHHMIEAAFKAFARALRVAVSVDPEESGVPSTKGTLSE